MLLTRRAFGLLSLAAFAPAAVPKRRWTIFVIQHSHIDNGFTERQEVIADYRAQFVRQAIAFARSPKQQDWSPETRFKYTFEGFWAVEQFLKNASSQEKQALLDGLRGGYLELSGSYFNLLDLADQDLLEHSVQFAADFARTERVPLKVAMCCDVNGVSQALADAFVKHGIARLSMNINPDQGGYPFGKPLVPFEWETPSGKRLLVWNGLAYHKANLLGLMGGSVPAGDPGIPGLILPGMSGYVQVKDTSVAESKLLPFLAWLEQTGYPYDFLPLMGSGTYTDNSPPGDEYCAILSAWNAKFGSGVKVRTATLNEFFNHLEGSARHLPVYRGEWTNWWDDTAASAPNDTALYRNALRNRRLISLLDPAKTAVPQPELDRIDRQLLCYCEHTFGYSKTVLPSLLGEQVFARKSEYATEADRGAGAVVDRLLKSRGAGPFTADQPFAYTVLNPYGFRKQELVGLPVNFWEAPFLESGIRVIDAGGKTMAFQVEQSARGRNVFIRADLEPAKSTRYRIVSATKSKSAAMPEAPQFANHFYQMQWSAERGIESYRAAGGELLNAERGGIGCPVYQIFPGANRSQAGAVSGERVRPRDEVSFGKCTAVRRLSAGPLFESVEFNYSVRGAEKYLLNLRCYRDLPYFDVSAQIVKTEVDDPEGLYIYFPFNLPQSRWVLDKAGVFVQPGLDQLPGTCCDYYSVLSGAAQVGREAGIAWVTLDAPLVQIGELKLWQFTTTTDGTGPLYSWITNNKWQTNTRYRCGGSYEMRYRIEYGAEWKSDEAAVSRCRELSSELIVMRS